MSSRLYSITLVLVFVTLFFVGIGQMFPSRANADSQQDRKEKASILSSSPIIAFVSTKDPAKAKVFYQDVLKLTLVADQPFALVFDANGTKLHVQKVKELTVLPYTALGWKVSDIVAVIKDLTERGVTFERYKGLTQDEIGVCTFPGGNKVAWFRDTDGNTLSITQSEK